MRRLKRCLEPGCSLLVYGSRCADHRNAIERARTVVRMEREPWRRFYRTKRWQQLRAEVFARDGYRCRFIDEHGDRCTFTDPARKRLEAHHLDPPSEQPSLEEARIVFFYAPRVVTACVPHHREADASRLRAKVSAA